MYAIFKFLTASPTPNTPKPSIFDFTGKAKWDAWATAGKTYQERPADAESRYLEIARNLGWSEGKEAEVETPANVGNSTANEEEDIWDSDSEVKARKGESAIMGRITSTMVVEDDETSSALSNIAIAGDVDGLQSYLEVHPDVDVNARDENVSPGRSICPPMSPADGCTGIYSAAPGCRQGKS